MIDKWYTGGWVNSILRQTLSQYSYSKPWGLWHVLTSCPENWHAEQNANSEFKTDSGFPGSGDIPLRHFDGSLKQDAERTPQSRGCLPVGPAQRRPRKVRAAKSLCVQSYIGSSSSPPMLDQSVDYDVKEWEILSIRSLPHLSLYISPLLSDLLDVMPAVQSLNWWITLISSPSLWKIYRKMAK